MGARRRCDILAFQQIDSHTMPLLGHVYYMIEMMQCVPSTWSGGYFIIVYLRIGSGLAPLSL